MRNPFFAYAGATLLFAALTASIKAETNFHLLWKPVVGEVHRYKISVKFDYGDATMDFESNLLVKVLKVAEGGDYTIQTSTSHASIQSGENKKDLPLQPPVTETYGKTGLPKGNSLKDRDPDPFADLLEHLTEYEAPSRPVKIGDDWTNHPLGPKSGFFSESRVSYHLAEVFQDGKRHLARIHYYASQGDDPEAATGTIILDRTNNYLSEVEASIPHFKPDDAAEEAAISISVKEIPPVIIKSGP